MNIVSDKLKLLATLIILSIFQSAFGEEGKVDFSRDIRPILAENCFPCHGPDKSHRKANLRLDEEKGAKLISEGLAPIYPGSIEKSEVISRISAKKSSEIMPPVKSGKKLTELEKEKLARWIKQGAQWSKHWAYEKPIKHPSPKTINPKWATNGIDILLLAKMESKGLSPSPDADSIALLRRVHFDLIGLPPTIAEVKEYLGDSSPKAFENVVDKLLSRHHFGERLAMYWLDLVRYADTVGYHGDQDHHASPYRDFVINAFNRNLPFDQFSREQLAGDLLPKPTTDQIIATCYNRLLQTSHEGGVQAKEYLAIYAADRVRNFSAVWLGGTMGCAQCHDHKFDPYTMRDFYSLVAFFADIDEAKHLKAGSDSIPTKRLPEMPVQTSFELLQLEELKSAIAKLAINPSTEQKKEIENLRTKLKNLEKNKRMVMVTQAITPRIIRILPRGNWLDDSGEVVNPAIPQFLGTISSKGKTPTRLDLANWLFDTKDGIGGLTARVFVNRVWCLFFGNGLARNLDDFGAQGDAPIHPEILDNLALDFINSGWNIKSLVKQIVMTRAYQQSSAWTNELRNKDPKNEFFARQESFRLPAEMIRDNALVLSGLLVDEIGGGSIKPYQPAGYYRHLNFPKREYESNKDLRQWRRAVYVHWQRQYLHPMLKALDAPNREECTAKRQQSNTPLAALVLLNDPTFVESARVMAQTESLQSALPDEKKIQRLFQIATSRLPNNEESTVLRNILQDARKEFRDNPQKADQLVKVGLAKGPSVPTDSIELAAWTSVCRVILNLAETTFRN